MNYKKFIYFFIFLLVFSGCGKKSEKAPEIKTQTEIEQIEPLQDNATPSVVDSTETAPK